MKLMLKTNSGNAREGFWNRLKDGYAKKAATLALAALPACGGRTGLDMHKAHPYDFRTDAPAVDSGPGDAGVEPGLRLGTPWADSSAVPQAASRGPSHPEGLPCSWACAYS